MGLQEGFECTENSDVGDQLRKSSLCKERSKFRLLREKWTNGKCGWGEKHREEQLCRTSGAKQSLGLEAAVGKGVSGGI